MQNQFTTVGSELRDRLAVFGDSDELKYDLGMVANPYESPQHESTTKRQKFPWRLVFWLVLICVLYWIVDTLDSQMFTLARPDAIRRLKESVKP